ncbi:glucose-dependent insulinotropic receptor [Amia ocellicauda]|uniref:glucose-dependent insulinotropic receptor n=1 Tax=Amia ocellicauda TaxID=2972642 RepID=UPI00346408D5
MDPELFGLILSVGSVLIISTNLLVGGAVVLLIRKKGGLSWVFVLNLALADALVGLAITGIAAEVMSAHNDNKDACLLRMALVTSPSAASILTMFLISLDRYLAIKLPLHYSRLVGARAAASALALLWLASVVVGFLPGMVPGLQKNDYNGFCTFFSVVQPRGMSVVFCAGFFPVLSIFVYFYCDILKIACSHQRQICHARLAVSHVPQPSRHRGHVKAMRTVALLVGCFTLSWSPFFITSTVQVLCHDCKLQRVIENYLWLLGLSNSLINPLVYACWQREVRQQLGVLLAVIKGKISPVASTIPTGGRHPQTTTTMTTVLSNIDSPVHTEPDGHTQGSA